MCVLICVIKTVIWSDPNLKNKALQFLLPHFTLQFLPEPEEKKEKHVLDESDTCPGLSVRHSLDPLPPRV